MVMSGPQGASNIRLGGASPICLTLDNSNHMEVRKRENENVMYSYWVRDK
jgi:hypothetical protein